MFIARLSIGLLSLTLLVDATEAARPAAGLVSRAEVLEVGRPLARFALLTPATRVYLRYKIVGDRRETVDLWLRKVSFDNHEGRRLLHIVWRWDSVGDQTFRQSAEFWFEPETFRPITVERRITRDGKSAVQGYRYLPDRVEGLAELAGNSQKDFVQLAKMPAYNWETDMELLQTLPLALGYDVKIPFYEAGPGNDMPQNYNYKVVGEEKIVSTDGHAIDCWIVGIDSEDPQWGPTRLWYAKKGQIMIREETQLKDGTIFVKMLVPYDVGIESFRPGA